MALWRGYREYAVTVAERVRTKLGLTAYDQLDIFKLAAYYGITVVRFDEINCGDEVIKHFTTKGWRQLSGYILPVGDQLVMCLNPLHSEERIRSTMGHETSHVILNHEFDLLLTAEKACVSGSKDEEDEADWLGAELLFPRAAARRAVLRSIPIEQVCQHYGVSFEIARWRTNICGAKKMLKRSRQ